MSDLEYVGETEIEVTYSSYLGFIKNIHTVNGIEYDGTQKQIARLDPNWNGSMGKLDHATYKVLQQFPEARYFQVMRRTKVKERLFLGSTVTEKATIRAYKLKKGEAN